MADATQVLTLLGDGYVRKNDKGELVLLAFQVDKDGQDVPVGSEADPLYVLLADGQEVTITDSTFNNDINKVGNVSVPVFGAGSTLASTKAVPTNSMVGYSDGTNFVAVDAAHPLPVAVELALDAAINLEQVAGELVVLDDLGDINGIDISGRLAQTNHSVMYGLYNNTDYILPIGTDVQGSNSGIGNYAALFTNDAVIGWGSESVSPAGQFITDAISNSVFMPAVGAYAFAYVPENDNGETLYATNGSETYDPTLIAVELAVANNLKAIAGVQTDYVDNAGYRAQVMGLVGNGNSYYADVLATGDDPLNANGLVVIADLSSIYGTLIANQGNASGWVPSSLGDGFGQPIDGTAPGTWQGPNPPPTAYMGIVTTASLDAVGGVALSPAQENSLVWTGGISPSIFGPYGQSLMLGIDPTGNIYSATGAGPATLHKPQDDFATEISNSNVQGIDFIAHIASVGGVALSPAFKADWIHPIDLTADNSFAGSNSMLIASSPDNSAYGLTMTYQGDGFTYLQSNALDTATTFWGRQGVSDAISLQDMWDTGFLPEQTAPVIHSIVSGTSVEGSVPEFSYPITQSLMQGNWDDLNTALHVGLDTNTKIATWGKVGVSDAVDLTVGYLDATSPVYAPTIGAIAWAKSDVDTNFYNVNSSAVGPGASYQGLMVKNYAGTDNQTDTFTTAVPGTTRNFTAQNRTWQVGSDDPLSVGLAFSITLEISIDGGTRWAVIDTKTEANVNDAPTTIANKPGAIYRTNCGSLTLGATATNVTASVLAAM